MNVRAAKKICEVLGRVIPTANPRESEGGNFIRVRVSIDVTGPLCRGRLVSIGKEKQVWISFKYERLSNIYHCCGYFDHDDKDHEIWLNSEGSLDQEQKQFGPNLRAALFSYSHKQVIQVPGFYKSTPTKNQTSAEKETVGSKTNVELREKMKAQAEERRAPPSSREETDDQRCDLVDVDTMELRQNVTKLMSQTSDTSNDARKLK